MKATILAAAASLAAIANAQYYNITSKPFHLVLESQNATLNGATLSPCHEGAAIEGLCLGNKDVKDSQVYHFNTSYYDIGQTFDHKIGQTGALVFTLQSSFPIPSALTLSEPNPASNVGVPLFFPGSDSPQLVAFDQNNLMNIQSYIDDRTVPATLKSEAYYRWYICQTNAGYFYTTLAWVYGNGKPQNPSCQKVNVKKVCIE